IEPPVSATGIELSRVRPTRPWGVKLEPRSVTVLPTTTFCGEASREKALLEAVVVPWPNTMAMPKTPLKTSIKSKPTLTQKTTIGDIRCSQAGLTTGFGCEGVGRGEGET